MLLMLMMNEDYDIFVVSKNKTTRVMIMVILMMTTIMIAIVITAMIIQSRKGLMTCKQCPSPHRGQNQSCDPP